MEILLVKANSDYSEQMKKRMMRCGHHLDVAREYKEE